MVSDAYRRKGVSMINNENSIAFDCRIRIIKLGVNGCFVGSALSCIDLLVCLYYSGCVSPDNSKGYFFLSKGHAAPALYAVLESLGVLDGKRFEEFNSTGDHLYLHPNAAIPGINIHSGSLGHGISIAAGVAYDLKKCKDPRMVYVLVGDGELNEGSNWESLLVASAKKLSNLCIIVDRNHFQANYPTEELIPLEKLEDKFESFGANVITFNGHNFSEIHNAFTHAENSSKVTVLIANTVRGKGIPSIEGDWEHWFMEYSESEGERLVSELYRNRGDIE